MQKSNRFGVSDWVQAIGIAGVIAGLILVAYELRQNSQIARAEMNAQQLDQSDAIFSAFQNPEFAAVFQKMLDEPGSLSPYETLMIDGHFRKLMGMLILERLMVQRGIFDNNEDFWGDWVVRHGLGTDFGRTWWLEHGEVFGGNKLPVDEALRRLDDGEIVLEYMPSVH